MTKQKVGNLVVKDLRKRSQKSLEYAKQILLDEKIEQPDLNCALEHYVANWGEFTHPGLFSMAYEAAGADPAEGLQAQAAILMFTAAFDIHDDIIDRSTEKHNVPTVYGKFGAEMALLLGNAFLIEGFKLFAESIIKLPLEKQKDAPRKLQELLYEVGNAHALELALKDSKNITASEYLHITELKAASLEADMYFGALFAGAKDAENAALARIGRLLGILLTLRDDIVDIFDAEELHQRIQVQDLPIPLILAMGNQEIKASIMPIISKPELTKSDVAELVEIAVDSPPVKKLKTVMQQFVDEGLYLSSKLLETKPKSKLQNLLKFMLEDL
ncbi:MAG: polyprenyl synthetase family protein [Candidatus Bathyarchaeota archaeon]|nr:polyprenyl synthetase family protein [Candidatus Bathyarchaeota archaeon]